MSYPLKLTTTAACEVVGLNRDRFNEFVAAGHFGCAPKTVAGRARVFDPDDMVSLFYFKRLMDDGLPANIAGSIACIVGLSAKALPDEPVLAYVQTYVGVSNCYSARDVPAPDTWATSTVSGSDIRKVTLFNVAKDRRLIEHYSQEYASTVGPRDE